jgi:hypothetical protein
MISNLAELADHVRILPLSSLLEREGLHSQRQGNSTLWKSEKHAINVTGLKWFDHKAGKGGHGAIDLLMHLRACPFEQAVPILAQDITMPISSSETVPQRDEEELSSPEHRSSERHTFDELRELYAQVDPDRWPAARSYLTQVRHLPPELIDRLHRHDDIYANDLGGVVFLHRTVCGNVAGATIRSLSPDSKFRQCLGSKSSAWFTVGRMETASRVVIVESPIDALSWVALGQATLHDAVVSVSGSHVPELLIRYAEHTRKRLAFALDHDAAGKEGTHRAYETHLNVCQDLQKAESDPFRPYTGIPECLLPKGKDWNEDLLALRQTHATGDRHSTVSITPTFQSPPVGSPTSTARRRV